MQKTLNFDHYTNVFASLFKVRSSAEPMPEVIRLTNDRRLQIQYRNIKKQFETAREKFTLLTINVRSSFVKYVLLELQKS